ncbi:MAG: hypothetical protein NTX06_09160, partial [Proteobacteria bacterium]|nr:hypothetical protein [Pseudomonadota bacterium]
MPGDTGFEKKYRENSVPVTKLLLVSANQYTVPCPVYPLGISYLETYIKERSPEYDIQLFDFMVNSHADFVELLQKYKPDYVGISLR